MNMNNIDNVTFSIIIPLYNKENSITATINSVLCQTFSSFELIVVDDGSTDNSVRLVESFMDNRIKLIRKNNEGVSIARNIGIKSAKGKIIYLLDADDIIVPDCLNLFSLMSTKYPKASVFAANFKVEAKKTGDSFAFCPYSKSGYILEPFKLIYLKQIFLRVGSFAFYKNVVDRVGLFDQNLTKYEDIEFIFRVLKEFKLAFDQSIVLDYNIFNARESLYTVGIHNEWAGTIELALCNNKYERKIKSEHLCKILSKRLVQRDFSAVNVIIKNNIKYLHFLVLSLINILIIKIIDKVHK